MTNNNNKFFTQILKNLPTISDGKLTAYFKEIQLTKEALVKEIKNKAIAPLDIVYQNNDLEEIKNIANNINNNFKKVIVLGVGGSSLGGKTLTAIKNNPKIEIDYMESIDSNSIKNKLQGIDLKNTLFLVISKSGETIETICQTLIIIEKFKENNITDLTHNFLFITQDQENSITKIAKELGSKIYFHPNNIGGRFSYLTIVGLLPAALVGLDIQMIRQGAQTTLDNFINEDIKENDIAKICTLQLYLFDNGFKSNVIMPYIDALKDFTDWYRQLWAESLGKNGFGSTPINSMGTIDQHSQLQLYLDGPKDKFFTFISNKNHNCDFKISDLSNCQTRFGGKNLNKIMTIEQNSTIEILEQQNLPIRILQIDKLNECSLGALMMQMFLETIVIAKAQNINPFDQPAVELRKDLAKKYLNNN